MSGPSKGPELRYHDGVVCDANGRLRAVLYSDPKLLDAVLYPDRVTTERALEERDALGRKMAASPEAMEAIESLTRILHATAANAMHRDRGHLGRFDDCRSSGCRQALNAIALGDAALKKAGAGP